ncbi:hypothetical protein PUN28_020184 [Cardiocondyla obscurior]|uniref:Uncharacterized protein n=1 Tax=Cardiocondyla obscurior TaxID=286306 RepID=A0AAW2E7S8_9HYME
MGDRDPLVSFGYANEDEEARQTGRAGLNKNEKSPNITKSTELRSTIEKRLAGKLDYSASQRSPRHSYESRDRVQKLNAGLFKILQHVMPAFVSSKIISIWTRRRKSAESEVIKEGT